MRSTPSCSRLRSSYCSTSRLRRGGLVMSKCHPQRGALYACVLVCKLASKCGKRAAICGSLWRVQPQLASSSWRRVDHSVLACAGRHRGFALAETYDPNMCRADIISMTELPDSKREDIISALATVAERAKSSKSYVVIYWAGHSYYDK